MRDRNTTEILGVPLAHETRARIFYERLARRQGDTPVGDLFAFLAEEEEGHIRKLSAKHGIPTVEDVNTRGLLSDLESEERIHLAKIEAHLKELQEPRGAIPRSGGRHEDIESR